MSRRDTRWTWSKVTTIHVTAAARHVPCDGAIRSYRYRIYPPADRFFERCIGLVWCSACREYSATMVHVPRAEHLDDLLADLPASEQERLGRTEVKLLDHLDRIARAGGETGRSPR